MLKTNYLTKNITLYLFVLTFLKDFFSNIVKCGFVLVLVTWITRFSFQFGEKN